jgi:hypothetical protein
MLSTTATVKPEQIYRVNMSRILLLLGVVLFLGSCTPEYDWPPESSPKAPTGDQPTQ